MALTFLFLYAPIIILIVFSLQRGQQLERLEGLLPALVRGLFHNRLIMHSVYITLMVSLPRDGDRDPCGHICLHRALLHAPQKARRTHGCEQHPHDERRYCHGRGSVPAVCGALQRLGCVCRVGELVADARRPAGAADDGLRHAAAGAHLFQHSVHHPRRRAEAAPDGTATSSTRRRISAARGCRRSGAS